MPLYEYKCENCGTRLELYKHSSRFKEFVKCKKCGKRMRKMVSQISTQQLDNPRWSFAMGVNIGQIEQAKRLYPGSVYNEKGYLLVKNRHHKKELMKQRRMAELD